MAESKTLSRVGAVHGILPVLHILGLMIAIFSSAMVVPLLVSLWYQDSAQIVYDESIAITFASGMLLWFSTRRYRRELMARDSFLLVGLVWTVLPIFATLPLLLYIDDLNFTGAYFETVSGITTTGATVLSNLDGLPPSINLWRCQLTWLGGMGIIVLAVAIFPLLGVGGMQIYRAETPGPMKDTRLTPRVTQTANGLWLVYALITTACILSFRLAGMTWFDAICHAFTTIGLGGFSTHDDSFAYFDSPAIEAVAILFMLVAALNFATHFMVWRQKSVKPYAADPEAWLVIAVVLSSCLFISLYLWMSDFYEDFTTALRYASFNVVSIATTTGYANTDFNLWPIFAPLWMLLLCCFVPSSGSTGGGIKMIRAELMFRQGLREMVKLIHPQAQVPLKLRGQIVTNQIVFAVLAFMSIYGASLIVMVFLLLASGLDPITAASAVIASINNTGPGLNLVGPAATYAVLTPFQMWICIFAMLIGRLELFTVFVLFTGTFWRR